MINETSNNFYLTSTIKRAMQITTKDINVFRSSTWTTWIENILVVFIISLAFYSLLKVNTHFPSTKKLIITKGSTNKSIISQLNENGYDVGYIDYLMFSVLRKNHQNTLKDGEIELNTPFINRIDFLQGLTKAKLPP